MAIDSLIPAGLFPFTRRTLAETSLSATPASPEDHVQNWQTLFEILLLIAGNQAIDETNIATLMGGGGGGGFTPAYGGFLTPNNSAFYNGHNDGDVTWTNTLTNSATSYTSSKNVVATNAGTYYYSCQIDFLPHAAGWTPDTTLAAPNASQNQDTASVTLTTGGPSFSPNRSDLIGYTFNTVGVPTSTNPVNNITNQYYSNLIKARIHCSGLVVLNAGDAIKASVGTDAVSTKQIDCVSGFLIVIRVA